MAKEPRAASGGASGWRGSFPAGALVPGVVRPFWRALRPSTRLNWAWVVALAIVSLAVLGKGERVGDGCEYYLMLFSWAEQLQGHADQQTIDIYHHYIASYPGTEGLVPWSALQALPNVIVRHGEADFAHFWFYSLLAALFYWPLQLLRLDPALSFNCLHLLLVALVVHLGHRLVDARFSTAFLLTVTCSPLLWFINKAHTELFTVCVLTAAVAAFVGRRRLLCSLLIAVAGTQNPPFFLLALVPLCLSLLAHRGRALARHVGSALLVVALGALHVGYYLVRIGVPTPQLLTGGARMDRPLVLAREALCFLLDPDAGLLANWLLAVPTALLFLVCLRRGAVRWWSEGLALSLAALLLVGFAHSRTAVFNHGGTVSISRYALWYLPGWCWMLWVVLRTPLLHRGTRLGQSLLLAGLGAASAVAYHPHRPEENQTATAVSRWLYRYLPEVYQPVPEIFAARRLRTYPAGMVWAVAADGCQKVLVFRHEMMGTAPGQAAPVWRCPRLDPVALSERAAVLFRNHPSWKSLYLDHPGPHLWRTPALAPGRPILFARGGPGLHMLAGGWSHVDHGAAWSVGGRGEVQFAVEGSGAQGYVLASRFDVLLPRGARAVQLVVRLNGVPLESSTISEPGSQRRRWPIAVAKLVPTNVLVFETSSASGLWARLVGKHPGDLGVGLRSLELRALSSPSDGPD